MDDLARAQDVPEHVRGAVAADDGGLHLSDDPDRRFVFPYPTHIY